MDISGRFGNQILARSRFGWNALFWLPRSKILCIECRWQEAMGRSHWWLGRLIARARQGWHDLRRLLGQKFLCIPCGWLEEMAVPDQRRNSFLPGNWRQ